MPTVDDISLDELILGDDKKKNLVVGLPLKMNKEDTPMPDADTKPIPKGIEGLLAILEEEVLSQNISPSIQSEEEARYANSQLPWIPKLATEHQYKQIM